MKRREFITSGATLLAASAATPGKAQGSEGEPAVPVTTFKSVDVKGIRVFYREAGPANGPVLLLLHGFPSSSFMFRNLFPQLANIYRVIAPDLPGFGFTRVSPELHFRYTFDALAEAVLGFLDALHISRYALYVFDYGAPTGFRVAMARPGAVSAIISQNGNAYEQGLGEAWRPIQRYWSEPTAANREIVRKALDFDGLRWQYTVGAPNPALVDPASYTLDAAMIERPGNMDIQLDLFLDYANNVKLYPTFQKYFRDKRPPLLAIWGKHDPFFIPAGAEAFKKDIPNATVTMLDAGHFALETNLQEIASGIRAFMSKDAIHGME